MYWPLACSSPKPRALKPRKQNIAGRLHIAHLFQLGAVGAPQISPEGDWIAYTVSRESLEEDKSFSRIWLVPSKGGKAIDMTAEGVSSSSPRWSPDDQYIAFLSARDEGQTQVWRLFRNGGEAEQITKTVQSVSNFAWSPDSKRMLLVLQDPTEAELAAKKEGDDYKEKTRPAWVMDRQQFKSDYVGYLDRRRNHIYSLDIESDKVSQLTFGDYDDDEASWSPDGSRIAFSSNRSENPDNNYNADIWTVNSQPGETPAELTKVSSSAGPDKEPAWSPDRNPNTTPPFNSRASSLRLMATW